MGKIVNMPNTREFKLGDLNLQLRLDAKSVFKVESRLEEGIQGLFIKGQGEMKIPPINKMLIVLHGANQTSGITEKRLLDGYFDYIDVDGGSNMDIFTLITELATDAGLFGSKKEVTETDGESEEEELLSLTAVDTEETVL